MHFRCCYTSGIFRAPPVWNLPRSQRFCDRNLRFNVIFSDLRFYLKVEEAFVDLGFERVMDVCSNGDTAGLDPELLQIPEVFPSAVTDNSRVAEELFDQWLSLPETNSLVKSLLNNAKAGGPLNVSVTSYIGNASATNSLLSMFPAGSAPPLSPRSSSGSPRIMKHKAAPSALGSPLNLVNEPVKELIPQFYFQNGRPPPNELKERCLFRVRSVFLWSHEWTPNQ